MEKKVQWNFVAAAWVLVLGLLFIGWQALRRPAPGAAAGAAAVPAAAGKPVCPLDRKEVALGPDTPRVIYQGQEYVFCGDKDAKGRDHKTLFLMDPELYLRGRSSLQSSLSPTAAP